jgi:hypothetical protein
MGRPKKTQETDPKEETPAKAAKKQPKEFSEVPAEGSPEYIEYIKSIRVSSTEKKEQKGFGELLKEANQARADKARRLKEAAEKRAEEVSEGKTVKK